MDFVAACLDEVALEGLDGITLDALWLRLETRSPAFSLPLDDHTKHFLWSKVLAIQSDLQFYELAEERKALRLFDRFATVMEETGVIVEQESFEDIYPVVEVDDLVAQVIGSCSTYHTRQLVTPLIRGEDLSPLVTLSQAVDRWGSRLVLVASQKLRTLAICGSEKVNAATQITLKCYIMLERIARSRYHGEVTQGTNSLKCLDANAKTLFYQKRILEMKGLITTQRYNSRTLAGQNLGGSLMHIRRFYVKRESRYDAWRRMVYDILSRCPDKYMVLPDLRKELNVSESAFKHFQKAVLSQKMVESIWVKKVDFYPELRNKKVKGKRRPDAQMKVVRLVQNFNPKKLGEDSESDENEEEEGRAGPEGRVSLVMEKPLIVQVYEFLLQRGADGVCQSDVSRALNLTKLDARSVMRYLERLDLCQSALQDQGKQRVYKYVANELRDDCQVIRRLNKEKKLVMEQTLMEDSMDLGETPQDITMTDDGLDNSLFSPDGITEDPRLSLVCSMAPEYIDCYKKGDGYITYRWLRRANTILEMLNEMRLVDGVCLLRRKIMAVEEVEGMKFTIDRKSVFRILYRLQEGGHIRVFTKNVDTGDGDKKVELFAHKDMTETDPVVMSYLDNQSQHLRALTSMKKEGQAARAVQAAQTGKVEQKTSRAADPFSVVPRDSACLNYGLLSSQRQPKEMQSCQTAGRVYGFKPKMRRAEVLHKFLWYIVHGSVEKDVTPLSDREMDFSSYPPVEWETLNPGENPIPDDVLSTFKVYSDSVDWRRFVPPITPHKGYSRGWFQIGAIILVMPVSIFMSLIRITYKIRGLPEILRDPIRRHVTVSQLPSAIRQSVMFHRYYLFRMTENLQQLCYLGLLSFGTREHLEKHQIYCYLHQRGSIINTTNQPAEGHLFEFEKYETVMRYWYQLQYTAINTPLHYIVNTECNELKRQARIYERFKDCLRAVEVGQVCDDGTIPGDGRGACGMDGSQFLHMKRNWYWAYDKDLKLNAMMDTETRRIEPGRGKKSADSKPEERKKKVVRTGQSARSSRATDKKSKTKSSAKVAVVEEEFEKVKVTGEEAIPKKGGKGVKRKAKDDPKSSRKRVKAPREKHEHYTKKAYSRDSRGRIMALKGYDKVDERILEKRLRDRVYWSDEEDSLLLMAVVTQRVLTYPRKRRDNVMSYFNLRDLLHELSPRFQNKSSRSIQRRMRYIMRNEETHCNTEVFVGEAMHDSVIREKVKDTEFSRALPQHQVERLFSEVYHLLRKRFSAFSVTPSPLPFLDSLTELHSAYEISSILPSQTLRFQEVLNHTDICFWVLHNTIHCAMLLSDRTGRAHELFQLFNQYPEDLLHRVFLCMRTDRLITKFKSFQKAPRMLPWNKISLGNPGLGGYQVSQRYMYNWFAKQYPRNVFESTSDCLDEFLLNPEEARETGDKGGFTAMTVALMALRQIRFTTVIPEHVITMLPRLQKQHKKETSSVLDPDDEEEDALIKEAERTRNQAKQGTSSEGVPTEACPETESHIEFQETQRTTSRLMVNLMHQTYYGFAAVNNYNPDNLLVVHECTISVQLKSESIKQHKERATGYKKDLEYRVRKYLTEFNHSSPFLHPKTGQEILKRIRLTYPREVDMEDLLQDCRSLYAYTDDQITELCHLHNVVMETGSLGLLENTLMGYRGSMARFEDHLALLLEYRMILRVGVVRIHYVAFKNARPWLIHSFKNTKGRTGSAAATNNPDEDILKLGSDLSLPAYFPEFDRKAPVKQSEGSTGQAAREGADKGKVTARSSAVGGLHEGAEKCTSDDTTQSTPDIPGTNKSTQDNSKATALPTVSTATSAQATSTSNQSTLASDGKSMGVAEKKVQNQGISEKTKTETKIIEKIDLASSSEFVSSQSIKASSIELRESGGSTKGSESGQVSAGTEVPPELSPSQVESSREDERQTTDSGVMCTENEQTSPVSSDLSTVAEVVLEKPSEDGVVSDGQVYQVTFTDHDGTPVNIVLPGFSPGQVEDRTGESSTQVKHSPGQSGSAATRGRGGSHEQAMVVDGDSYASSRYHEAVLTPGERVKTQESLVKPGGMEQGGGEGGPVSVQADHIETKEEAGQMDWEEERATGGTEDTRQQDGEWRGGGVTGEHAQLTRSEDGEQTQRQTGGQSERAHTRNNEVVLCESGALEMLDDLSSDEHDLWLQLTGRQDTDVTVKTETPLPHITPPQCAAPPSYTHLIQAPPRPPSTPLNTQPPFLSPPPIARVSGETQGTDTKVTIVQGTTSQLLQGTTSHQVLLGTTSHQVLQGSLPGTLAANMPSVLLHPSIKQRPPVLQQSGGTVTVHRSVRTQAQAQPATQPVPSQRLPLLTDTGTSLGRQRGGPVAGVTTGRTQAQLHPLLSSKTGEQPSLVTSVQADLTSLPPPSPGGTLYTPRGVRIRLPRAATSTPAFSFTGPAQLQFSTPQVSLFGSDPSLSFSSADSVPHSGSVSRPGGRTAATVARVSPVSMSSQVAPAPPVASSLPDVSVQVVSEPLSGATSPAHTQLTPSDLEASIKSEPVYIKVNHRVLSLSDGSDSDSEEQTGSHAGSSGQHTSGPQGGIKQEATVIRNTPSSVPHTGKVQVWHSVPSQRYPTTGFRQTTASSTAVSTQTNVKQGIVGRSGTLPVVKQQKYTGKSMNVITTSFLPASSKVEEMLRKPNGAAGQGITQSDRSEVWLGPADRNPAHMGEGSAAEQGKRKIETERPHGPKIIKLMPVFMQTSAGQSQTSDSILMSPVGEGSQKPGSQKPAPTHASPRLPAKVRKSLSSSSQESVAATAAPRRIASRQNVMTIQRPGLVRASPSAVAKATGVQWASQMDSAERATPHKGKSAKQATERESPKPHTPHQQASIEKHLQEIKSEVIMERKTGSSRSHKTTETFTKSEESVLKILAAYRVNKEATPSTEQGQTGAKKTGSTSSATTLPQTDGPPESKRKRSAEGNASPNQSELGKRSGQSGGELVVVGESSPGRVGEAREGETESVETGDNVRSGSCTLADQDDISAGESDRTTEDQVTQEASSTAASTCQQEEQGKAGATFVSGKQNHRPQRRGKSSLPDLQPTGTYERVRVIARPWKTPEGTVNRPVLRMMTEGILLHVMCKPASSLHSLYTKYQNILQPVLVRELVELLEEVGCVELSYLKMNDNKPRLFSGRKTFEHGKAIESCDEATIVMPTIDCILKMGQFQKQVSNSH